jgi:hydroxyacid-oxoacid transhydrogenase
MSSAKFETAFSMEASSIKYGLGVTREIGFEMSRLGGQRVMVVTDPFMAHSEPVITTMAALRDVGIECELFDEVEIEPTDASFKKAIEFATKGGFDGYVAVGGGSSIDTAKVSNLYATYPDDFLAYVNAPIGKGYPVPGPLKPLIAVPTTAGTGSETTGVAIFDFLEMRAKTGIAHRALRPTMGIVDPQNVYSMPKMVAACSGFDVLSHGLESFTAMPFYQREAPQNPGLRPAYQGANPISDVWSTKAIQMVSENIVRATNDPSDHEARGSMMLAATMAGVGFGNAGCHLPHGMSYPVAGMAKEFVPEGYPSGRPIVPHGMAVILNAPAVFRFTAPADPKRHLHAAMLMGADTAKASDEDAGELVANSIINLIRQLGLPNGLAGVGYSRSDVEDLVSGTLPQHRVTKLAPRPAGPDDLHRLFLESLTLW